MAPTIFADPNAMVGQESRDLGASEWLEIDQARIDGFAAVTGDDQWIHVDPARAAKGPFGATIAHGYLTLALVNYFLPQIVKVEAMGINIGCENVRFLAPVKVGSRIRGVGRLEKVEVVKGGAVQSTVRVTVEIEGGGKPACIVDTISRYYPETPA